MQMTIDIAIVVAVVTILGAMATVMLYYGKLASNYAIMNVSLVNINKELVEMKTLMKAYDKEIHSLKLEMTQVKSSSLMAMRQIEELQKTTAV